MPKPGLEAELSGDQAWPRGWQHREVLCSHDQGSSFALDV